MKRVALLVSVLGVPAIASASQSFRLFDVSSEGIDKETRSAVAAMEKQCFVGEMRRAGPTVAERARCEKATQRAIARGVDAARYALARLDRAAQSEEWVSPYHLYDLVRQTGDLSLVETLIRGLEREAKGGMDNPRHYEVQLISQTLTALTYADPKGTPYIQWRAFWVKNSGKSKEDLVALRIDEARAQVKDDDFDLAFAAADFLARQSNTATEGLVALQQLKSRDDLSADQEETIAGRLRAMVRSKAKSKPNQLARRPEA